MERSFNTLTELRAEIGILKIKREQQESILHEKFNGPGAILRTMGSFFHTGTGKKSFLDDLFHQDIVTSISRVLLPVILNSSIFRGSGLITKALVAFFSQKAAKNVNTDMISTIADKIKSFFANKAERTKKTTVPDYGIPPDSETY